MDFRNELIEKAADNGFSISNEQSILFEKYKNLLLEWNKKMNLTAITNDTDIIYKHFIDSLFLSKAVEVKEGIKIADIGTGAGFPGIPLKIFYPKIKLTLVDSLNKRINFLNEVLKSVNAEDVATHHLRAEDFKEKGKFDICCGRAVARLNILAEWCMPFVAVGGYFVALKGEDVDEEVLKAKNAITTLGGEISEIYRYNLAKTDINHTIVVIKKTRQTPIIYPRTAAIISKKPLV